MNQKELDALIYELNTQDNAITAEPLFTVEQKQILWGFNADYATSTGYIHMDDGDYPSFFTLDEVREYLARWFEDFKEVSKIKTQDEVLKHYKVYPIGYQERWNFVCAHLTKKAAQRYIDENRHNLFDPRIFVTSQYRCPEYIALRNALIAGELEIRS